MERDFLVEGHGHALLVHGLVAFLAIVYGFLYDSALLADDKPSLLGRRQVLTRADGLDDLAIVVCV